MSKKTFITSAIIITSIFLYGNASAAETNVPEPKVNTVTPIAETEMSQENKLMLEASGKMVDIIRAQLSGDTAKLEKAANEAITIYNTVLTSNPSYLKAINGRGTVRENVKIGSGAEDFKNAIVLASKLIDNNPKDAGVLHDRAASYRGLKMYDKAREDYKSAIAADPSKYWWATELKAMEVEAK